MPVEIVCLVAKCIQVGHWNQFNQANKKINEAKTVRTRCHNKKNVQLEESDSVLESDEGNINFVYLDKDFCKGCDVRKMVYLIMELIVIILRSKSKYSKKNQKKKHK